MNAQIIPFPTAQPTASRDRINGESGRLDEFTIKRAAVLLARKWGPEGAAGREAQREREQQACDDRASGASIIPFPRQKKEDDAHHMDQGVAAAAGASLQWMFAHGCAGRKPTNAEQRRLDAIWAEAMNAPDGPSAA